MKKKTLALLLSAAMMLALAACNNSAATPTNDSQESDSPSVSEPAGTSDEGTVYTTTINDADVTITLSADQKSVTVDAMGMTVEGTCEVVDNVLTVKEQTSGNAQVWASLSTRTYTLNNDGTATAVDIE